MSFESINEALKILIDRHRDEFEGIHRRIEREIKIHGGILV